MSGMLAFSSAPIDLIALKDFSAFIQRESSKPHPDEGPFCRFCQMRPTAERLCVKILYPENNVARL